MKKLKGKVLWWDQRDGNGLIQDAEGTRLYFDTSVLTKASLKTIKSGKQVSYNINENITECLCAHKVRVMEN